MSTSTTNLEKTYSGKLAAFAGELGDHIDDKAMLQEVHMAITSLLAEGGTSEREIRAALQRRLDNGELREESFELVQKLIDRIVLQAAAPDELSSELSDDAFSSTTVLSTVTLEPTELGDNLQVGSVLRDRFMLLEEISGGSMGTVYKAMDRRLAEAGTKDHFVAIKVLSPRLSRDGNALRALQQEAAKTRCLAHPNIVRFIDLDRDDELYFMVLEWIEGRSLATILDDKKSKKIDVETALNIIQQVGAALEYAHQRGVVHADVKPGNIMITPDGVVKLFDFGIARVQQKQQKTRTDFDPAVLQAVSPAYSSMQVLTGEDPTQADDVFSLACLAYRLIAGYRVFGPRNAAEAAEAGMEPQRLDVLSKSQWAALKKALSFPRITRFASPAAFVSALQPETISVDPEPANDEWEEEPTGGNGWRNLAVLVIIAAAVAAVFQQEVLNFFNRVTEAVSVVQREASVSPEAADIGAPGQFAAATEGAPPVAVGDIQAQVLPLGSEQTPAQETSKDVTGGALDAQVTSDSGPTQGAEIINEAEAVTSAGIVTGISGGAGGSNASEAGNDTEARSAIATADPIIQSDAAPVITAVPPKVVGNPGPRASGAATAIVPLAGLGELPAVTSLQLMEDDGPLIIDFVRAIYLDESLELRLIDSDLDGSDLLRTSGQYSISSDGLLKFAAGQHKARITITMSSDPLRGTRSGNYFTSR